MRIARSKSGRCDCSLWPQAVVISARRINIWDCAQTWRNKQVPVRNNCTRFAPANRGVRVDQCELK